MTRSLKFFIFIMISFFCNHLIDAQIDNLRVSIIIPCHSKHGVHLYELLRSYELQTVLPDEVVISISEREKVSNELMNDLRDTDWAFPVKYILSKERVFAGENRNKACRIAKGDIFICQDADDLPDSRRIEIIKFFFSKYNVDHLMHCYYFSEDLKHINFTGSKSLEEMDFMYPRNMREVWSTGKKVHFGNIAIKRNVFDKIKWTSKPNGQDEEFDEKVYGARFKCMVVLEPLTLYRIELSSWKRFFKIA